MSSKEATGFYEVIHSLKLKLEILELMVKNKIRSQVCLRVVFLRSLVRGAIAFFFSSLLKETKENLKIFRPKTCNIKKKTFRLSGRTTL